MMLFVLFIDLCTKKDAKLIVNLVKYISGKNRVQKCDW